MLDDEGQRQNVKYLSPACSLLFNFPSSFLNLVSPPPSAVQGGMGNRSSSLSMTAPLRRCFLLTLFYPALVWTLRVLLLPSGEALPPIWALHRLQCLLGMSTCSSMGSSMGCSVNICFGVVFHGLQAGSLLHHGQQRGSLLWQLEHLISSFSHLSISAMVLSHFFPSLLTAVQHFCALLNTVSLAEGHSLGTCS